MSHWTAGAGVVTVALGAGGCALAVFGPAVWVYPPPATIPTGSESLWATGAPPQLAVFVLAMVAASVALAAGAWLRAASIGAGLPLAWLGAFVLVAGAVATISGNSTLVTPAAVAADIPDALGIGVYFVPAAIAGVVTAIATGAAGLGRSSIPAAQY